MVLGAMHLKSDVKSALMVCDCLCVPALVQEHHTHVAQTNMPVLIFHGTRDRVVPYASAVKLKESLKPSDQFITIQGGAHNNLETFVEYQTHINIWLGQ
jgi:pimeloyl-ACP methyl ester carboxylesterase